MDKTLNCFHVNFDLGLGLMLIMLGTGVFAQGGGVPVCTADDTHNKHLDMYSDVRRDAQILNELAATYRLFPSLARRGFAEYIIPIVFHVSTSSNPERVTQEQVESALEILNDDFNALNQDYAEISPEFKDLAADVGVRFVLPALDPDGNPTTGITYHQNDLCGRNDELKHETGWPGNQYLNIYVTDDVECNGADNNSGWAYLPSDRYVEDGVSGIVYNFRYLGRTGSSLAVPGNANYHMARVLTHEVGHYLNLHHTFRGFCSDPENDKIEDTPPIRWNNGTRWCPPGGPDDVSENHFSCDEQTVVNYENYMDYSDCTKMFTNGQSLRMLAALNSDVGYRTNLYSESNLELVGLGDVSIRTRPGSADLNNQFNIERQQQNLLVQFELDSPLRVEILLRDAQGRMVLRQNLRLRQAGSHELVLGDKELTGQPLAVEMRMGDKFSFKMLK